MTITYFPGASPMLRDPVFGANGLGVNALIDASGEKVAFVGNVWHPTVRTGTIKIRKVHFRTGAVTLNAASQVRVSLQNVSTTAGPPYQPDGTQDQFFDFKTATTTLTANAEQISGNLSADRDVDLTADSTGDTNSRRLAVVFEFQAFNTSDSVIISTLNDSSASLQSTGVVLNTGSYALLSSRLPIITLECDDGTFAFLQNSTPLTTFASVSIGNAATVRRAGARFKVPFAAVIDRLSLSCRLPNGADGRLVLYDSDGTTELVSIDYDNDEVVTALSDQQAEFPIVPITLVAETYYRLAFVSTTATQANMQTGSTTSAAKMDGCFLGQSSQWTEHNGTAWSETSTKRCFFGLGLAGIDIPAGGLLINPGMTGGLRG